jgi:hypothetical protein
MDLFGPSLRLIGPFSNAQLIENKWSGRLDSN